MGWVFEGSNSMLSPACKQGFGKMFHLQSVQDSSCFSLWLLIRLRMDIHPNEINKFVQQKQNFLPDVSPTAIM